MYCQLAPLKSLLPSTPTSSQAALLSLSLPFPRPATMLFSSAALFCLLSANFVASQFAKPEILAGYDPRTALQPPSNKLESKDGSGDSHVIRGLLNLRQSGCPTGYGECNNPAGRSVLASLLPFLFCFAFPLSYHAFCSRSSVCSRSTIYERV